MKLNCHENIRTGHGLEMGSPMSDKALAGGCLAVWLWSGWHPHEFSTWMIEQVATLLAIAVLWWLGHRTTFSFASKVCITTLFCVHTIGTHYTYSLTPYNELFDSLLSSSPNTWFGWERNHYDRFVHFSYGALLALPIVEAIRSRLPVSMNCAGFLMVQLVLSSSALYELMEWSAALMFGGELGTAYLGTQGDPWDAQADIALALAGSLLALAIVRSAAKPICVRG